MGRLLAVNIAAVTRTGDWTGDVGETGIDKRPVTHPVRLFDDHVDGDHVMDRAHHGGPSKAVYAYAREDATWWEAAIGRPIPTGSFGENLTTADIAVTGAIIGEVWRIGTATLRVTEPRIPCRVFAGFWDRPHLVREFTDAGRPGAYLAIVDEGSVQAGDAISVLHRPDHGVTLGRLFAARTNHGVTRDEVRAARADLSPTWQAWLDAGN